MCDLYLRVSAQGTALELSAKKGEIKTLDGNYEKLMEVSLEEDCQETKSSIQELHQLFDAVMQLLRDRINEARKTAGMEPLNLDELLAELAELRDWLQAVEKWLIGQEHDTEAFSDATKAEQQRQKYEVSCSFHLLEAEQLAFA